MRSTGLLLLPLIDLLSGEKEMTKEEIFEKLGCKDIEKIKKRYTRYVKDKTIPDSEKLIVEKNGKWCVTDQYIKYNTLTGEDWNKLLTICLNSGNLDTYMAITSLVPASARFSSQIDKNGLEKYKKDVLEPERHIDIANREIRIINRAIAEMKQVTFSYKTEKITGLPLYYYIRRDGVNKYLILKRHGKILVCSIDKIKNAKIFEREKARKINKTTEDFMRFWDTPDPAKNTSIRLVIKKQGLLYEKGVSYEHIKKELLSYTTPNALTAENDNEAEFSFELYGTTGDFMKWIRKYGDVCVLKNEKIAKERIKSIDRALERYGDL